MIALKNHKLSSWAQMGHTMLYFILEGSVRFCHWNIPVIYVSGHNTNPCVIEYQLFRTLANIHMSSVGYITLIVCQPVPPTLQEGTIKNSLTLWSSSALLIERPVERAEQPGKDELTWSSLAPINFDRTYITVVRDSRVSNTISPDLKEKSC